MKCSRAALRGQFHSTPLTGPTTRLDRYPAWHQARLATNLAYSHAAAASIDVAEFEVRNHYVAEAKEWHGLRRLRLRGLLKANIPRLLIAAGQNLKRLLAARGWGRRHAPCGSLLALPGEPQGLSAASG
jgi:hypothetical protein